MGRWNGLVLRLCYPQMTQLIDSFRAQTFVVFFSNNYFPGFCHTDENSASCRNPFFIFNIIIIRIPFLSRGASFSLLNPTSTPFLPLFPLLSLLPPPTPPPSLSPHFPSLFTFKLSLPVPYRSLSRGSSNSIPESFGKTPNKMRAGRGREKRICG